MLNDQNFLLSNRLFIQDGSTGERSYDFYSYKKMMSFYNENVSKILFDKENLLTFKDAIKNEDEQYNEVLARLRWSTDSNSQVFIGSDTLEARLLAREYALMIERYLEERNLLPDNYKVNICFYTPQDLDLMFKQYTDDEMVLDLIEAEFIYDNVELREEKYEQKNYEFLFGLSPEKIKEALITKHKSHSILFTLLTGNHVHILDCLIDKLTQNEKDNLSDFLTKSEEFNNPKQVIEVESFHLNENKFNYIKLVDFFSSMNVSIQLQDKRENTFLMYSIFKNNLNVVRNLLKSNVNINAQNKYGETALMHASKMGTLLVIDELIKAKASIDLQDKQGKTAFYYAVEYGNVKVAELLLAEKANINVKDKRGKAAFYYAVENGHVGVLQLLFSNRVDISDLNMRITSAFHIAAKNGHAAVLEFLLIQGLCQQINNEDFKIAFISALEKGHVDVIDLFLTYKKIEVDQSISFLQQTPLILAAEIGELEIVNLLLVKGAKTDKQDKYMNSALYSAAKQGYIEIVRVLLTYSANVNARQYKEGSTILMLPLIYKYLAIMHLFLQQKEIEIDQTDDLGKTALIHAAQNGAIQVVILLLEHGANINLQNIFGKTALIYAAQNGAVEIVSLLLEHGANINLQDTFGKTALIYAAKNGDHEIVSLLLAKGANINLRDASGKTAFDSLVEKQIDEIISVIVDPEMSPVSMVADKEQIFQSNSLSI